MKIQAAVAWEAGAPLSIEELDLDEPRADEILVRVEAVGVCHTDEVIKLTGGGADVALDTTGNPEVILAAVESLATHGTASVITSSGPPVTVPPGSLLLRGRSLRGVMGGHINPAVFLPRLLDLHRRGRFPFDRLVRNYPFTEVNRAIADHLSGATIKPVLTFPATS